MIAPFHVAPVLGCVSGEHVQQQRKPVRQVLRDEEEAFLPLPPAAAANNLIKNVVKVVLINHLELVLFRAREATYYHRVACKLSKFVPSERRNTCATAV